jgi:hypothetical protein
MTILIHNLFEALKILDTQDHGEVIVCKGGLIDGKGWR